MRNAKEKWSEEQIAAVYGIQGTLQATADLLGMTREGVRLALQRIGIDTSNREARGDAVSYAASERAAARPVPDRICERCGAKTPYPVGYGKKRFAALRFCFKCAKRADRRGGCVPDEELLDLVQELGHLQDVADRLQVTSLAVRVRLGTILFHWLTQEESNG